MLCYECASASIPFEDEHENELRFIVSLTTKPFPKIEKDDYLSLDRLLEFAMIKSIDNRPNVQDLISHDSLQFVRDDERQLAVYLQQTPSQSE